MVIFSLFVGFGLSIFLFLTHSWFYSLFFTVVTLFFDLCGILLLSKVGWRRLLTRSTAPRSGSPILFFVLFVLWVSVSGYYLSSPFFAQLLHEEQIARTEYSDPSCSPGLLRDLARQSGAINASKKPDSQSVCAVQWTRAVGGFRSRSCLSLDNGVTRADYCRPSTYRERSFASNGIHYGDMIVARTAFGRPSAFFSPSRTLATIFLYPRGEIVKTRDDPDDIYFRHLESTFMLLLCYLFFGSLFPVRLLSLPPVQKQ